MEAALETARRMMGCCGCKDYGGIFGKACEKLKDYDCENACFVLDDKFLTGDDE